MLFKSEQFFGKQKEHDMLIISKQQMFNYWEEMYKELNGNPNTSKYLRTPSRTFCSELSGSSSNLLFFSSSLLLFFFSFRLFLFFFFFFL